MTDWWGGSAGCVAVMLLGAAALPAQTVRGRVLETGQEVPIAGAEVALVNATGAAHAAAVSDDAGRFEVDAPEPGVYSLRVGRLGYQGYTTEPLDMGRDETVVVELRLGTQAVPVEPVVVTARRRPDSRYLAEFEARRDDPGQHGYFIDRDAIERRPVASPAMLVQGLPNVYVRNVEPFGAQLIYLPSQRAGGSRECLAHLFVDGVRLQGGTTLDDVVPAANVAAVEVYPRVAMVPLPYRASDQCGAVLLWTRAGEASGRGWGVKRIAAGLAGVLAVILVGIN
jgi:hypothetical protein